MAHTGSPAPSALTQIAATLGDVVHAVSAAISGAVTALQIARMEAAMFEMTDTQLKNIGITRADIPARARFLINGE